MDKLLPKQTVAKKCGIPFLQKKRLGKQSSYLFALITPIVFFSESANAQGGTWTAVAKAAPHANNSTMILLSDGTVLAHSGSGGTQGKIWDKLTPDINGSYVNGTWTSVAAMSADRLYFSSNVLKDGRLYVAGGEYGSGTSAAEVYDPVTNVWTQCPNPGQTVSDANSMILEDGRVIQALVAGNLTSTVIYNPINNTYSPGPSCLGAHNESAWVKLKDNSILMVERNSKKSERYIPAQNKWVADANVPVSIYDPYGLESGAAFLLPDGRAFFLSSLGQNAYYTPGTAGGSGTWQAAVAFPKGTPDAPAAMMPNGKILCIVSDLPTSGNHFPSPSVFYEFDYLTDSYITVSAPGGGSSYNSATYATNMLLLPDGSVLFSENGSTKYYVYKSPGTPVASGKPKISKINVTGSSGNCTYIITGTGFNGISEGAAYGDDEEMSSNYPLVRLSTRTGVYYARTSNWNSTGVMRGNLADTTEFTLPAGISATDTYSLVVVANGIASDPVSFVPCRGIVSNVDEVSSINNSIVVYPNPTNDNTTVKFTTVTSGKYTISVVDVVGRIVAEEADNALSGDNFHALHLSGIAKGVYSIIVTKGNDLLKTRIIIQ